MFDVLGNRFQFPGYFVPNEANIEPNPALLELLDQLVLRRTGVSVSNDQHTFWAFPTGNLQEMLQNTVDVGSIGVFHGLFGQWTLWAEGVHHSAERIKANLALLMRVIQSLSQHRQQTAH